MTESESGQGTELLLLAPGLESPASIPAALQQLQRLMSATSTSSTAARLQVLPSQLSLLAQALQVRIVKTHTATCPPPPPPHLNTLLRTACP